MNISHTILLARKRLKIKQKDLAKRVGISQTTLSKLENGNENINMKTLYKIMRELQLTVDVIPLDPDSDVGNEVIDYVK